MKIVLADVKSMQPGQLDAAADKPAMDDKFSRFFDRQLNREESLSGQTEKPQVVENNKVMRNSIEPVADLEQAHARVDDLNAEILANSAEAGGAQVAPIIEQGVHGHAVDDVNNTAGDGLPSDGNPLPPEGNRAPQWSVPVTSVLAQHQFIPMSESTTPAEQQSVPIQRSSMIAELSSIPAQQQAVAMSQQSPFDKPQSIAAEQQSVILQQSVEPMRPVISNAVNTVSSKVDAKAQASDGIEAVLMAKASLSSAVEPTVVTKSEFMVEKLNFGKAADFQFTTPVLSTESDLHNNLFRLHSPAGLSNLNQATQSLPPHLESLPLPNSRDQAALTGGLGERIQWMVNHKLNTATIRMDPPMLGRLEVHIRVADDVTNVTINTQNAQTRDLIDNASIRLRDFLQENGYENVNVDVSHQQQQQASAEGGVGEGFQADDTLSGPEPDLNPEVSDNRFYSSDSLVDYFA